MKVICDNCKKDITEETQVLLQGTECLKCYQKRVYGVV